MGNKVVHGTLSNVKSFVREPLNVALIVVLPWVSIQLYGVGLGAFPETLFTGLPASPDTVGQVTGAIFATTALAGILGLFQIISAAEADERLIVAGMPRGYLLATRLVTILGMAVVAAVVSISTLSTTVTIEAPFVAFGGLVVVGVLYSLLGVLVGSVLKRELEGSLVLVFLADIDNLLASGILGTSTDLAKLLPLYYPYHVVQSAVLDGSVSNSDVRFALLYVGVAFVVATVVYVRVTDTGGVLS